jgi:hypothetical protein
MLLHCKIKLRAALPILLACLGAAPAYADCTNPAGKEADVFYNGDYATYQFCNGTTWMAFGGGANCAAAGSYSPTTPTGSGYFVLSHDTYNGNLSTNGDLQGADAKCLTDLTTNTGWKGYSTANSNGQLVSDKVHAFLCEFTTCNNLMPLTTYYFANGGNAGAGGASFTTDSNGRGPNDSADWSAANYFSGSYNYWTARANSGETQWPNSTIAASGPGHCFYTWNYSASDQPGYFGSSANTDHQRWYATTATCDTTQHLVCFVNP